MGWIGYARSCFIPYADGKSWRDASASCREMGGHLAIIGSDDVNEFAAVELARPFPTVWIGLRRSEADPRKFNLPGGHEAVYANWDANEPKEHSGNGEDCVSIQSEDVFYSWRVKDCSMRLPYICERGKHTICCQLCPGLWNERYVTQIVTSLRDRSNF